MLARVPGNAGHALRGRVLAHGEPVDATVALLNQLAGRAGTGLVLTGPDAPAVRRAHATIQGPVVVDSGYWRKHEATTTQPMSPAVAQGGLFATSLDTFAQSWHAQGADVTLQPSGMIGVDRWDVFAAVRTAASQVLRPDVLRFFPLDAAMLDNGRAARLARELLVTAGPAALLFADADQAMAREGRAANLRWLLAEVPELAVLATEPLMALDVAAHEGAASIGIRSGLRRPERPQDRGKKRPMAAGWLPGLFLRDLLELRSPNTYADWYITQPSPTCGTCGRPLDLFSTTTADKERILLHTLHTWLDLADDMRRRNGPARQQAFLANERLLALDRHVQLHPFAPKHEVDVLLRRLAELDDPQHRRVRADGSFA
jgi:hypothetical protein